MLGAESSEEFDPKAGIPHSFMVVTHKALTASEISRDFDWTGYEEDIFKPSETTVHKYVGNEGNDNAAFVQDHDGLCYVAYQSSKTTTDWWQNANPNVFTLNNQKNDKQCQFRDGFTKAFIITDFQEDLEENMNKCVNNCDTSVHPYGCLIFTGHSQGGAIATVASFFYGHLPHRLITFANPPALVMNPSECGMQSSRSYRFVNALYKIGTVYNELRFDKVPFLSTEPFMESYHIGRMFLISGMKHNEATFYIEETLDPATGKLRTEDILYPWDHNGGLGLAHFIDIEAVDNAGEEVFGVDSEFDWNEMYYNEDYGSTIKKLMEKSEQDDMVSTNGFSYGAGCSGHNPTTNTIHNPAWLRDEMCDDGLTCFMVNVIGPNALCSHRSCWWQSDCNDATKPSFCDNAGFCRPKFDTGEGCLMSRSCKSGRCNWSFRCD